MCCAGALWPATRSWGSTAGRRSISLPWRDRARHRHGRPYIKLLDDGADVIVGGRSSDCAIFAAPAIRQGFPEGLAYFYGKVLKCASFCAEPYGGKESVLGEITIHDVKITAL